MVFHSKLAIFLKKILALYITGTKEIYISKEGLQVIISILHHVQILLFVNQYTTVHKKDGRRNLFDSLHDK